LNIQKCELSKLLIRIESESALEIAEALRTFPPIKCSLLASAELPEQLPWTCQCYACSHHSPSSL